MSSSGNEINLAGALPNDAIDLAESKPDVRSAYDTAQASSGEISGEIESANDNGQILDLGSGEYSMSGGVNISGSVGGIVGDGSDSCTINCSASSYLFSVSSDDFVMEGVTFQADGDVALASVQTGNAGWFEDVIFRGQRDKYSANGERMTFIIQADSGATNYIHGVEFPDGGTNHPGQDTVGHAIGPNADPGHEGYNVWHECYAEGFMDNGFYIAYSPGTNVMWNCTAVNNGGANFRPGDNDIIVGGYSEATDLPDDRICKPLSVDSGSNVNVIGLEMYGEGRAVGSGGRLIEVRSEAQDLTLDRTVAHGVSLGSHLARLDYADVTITDSWWLQEETSNTAVQIGDIGSAANVTADGTWRLRSTDSGEISGPVTIDGTSYSGSTSASEAGLGDPQPFPSFHFDGVESGAGSEYGGTGGGSATDNVDGVAGWTSEGPQAIDGSGSPGARWGLTEERVASIQGPQRTISTTVEPQWFNNGPATGGVNVGGSYEGGDISGDVNHEELYVNPSSGDDSADGTESAPLATIQEASNRIPYINDQDGWRINLAEGTYNEDVLIGPHLTSGGGGGNFQIVGNTDNPSSVEVNSMAVHGAHGIQSPTIAGISFTGENTVISDGASLFVYASTNTLVDSVEFQGGVEVGVEFYGGSQGIARNVDVSNTVHGIKAKGESTVTCKGCVGTASGYPYWATETSFISWMDNNASGGEGRNWENVRLDNGSLSSTPDAFTVKDSSLRDMTLIGDLSVTGSKNFVQRIGDGKEAVYTVEESGESRVIHEGQVRVGGTERVRLPSHFSSVLSNEDSRLRAQATPHDLVTAVVTETTPSEIVIESTEDVLVDYRVSGIRRGYENKDIVTGGE